MELTKYQYAKLLPEFEWHANLRFRSSQWFRVVRQRPGDRREWDGLRE